MILLFPKRLHNDLEEVQAYWFYKQNMWDSAAVHLENALSNATNKRKKQDGNTCWPNYMK